MKTRTVFAIVVFVGLTWLLLHQFAVGICEELKGTFDYTCGCCRGFVADESGRVVESEPWYKMLSWFGVFVAAVFSGVATKIVFSIVGRISAKIAELEERKAKQ